MCTAIPTRQLKPEIVSVPLIFPALRSSYVESAARES